MKFGNQGLCSILNYGYLKYKKKVALKDRNESITYEQLCDSVIRNSNYLTKIGLNGGDRVILFSENSVKFIEAYFAISNMGSIVVPVDSNISNDLLVEILNDAKPVALYTTKKLYKNKFQQFENTSIKIVVFLDKSNNYSKLNSEINYFYHNDYKLASSSGKQIKLSNNYVAAILYTSGTSSKPKGVV